MIDLLGDGHLTVRGGDEPLLELDLTYKVQTRPGGHRRGGRDGARTSQAASRSWSCSATTSSSTRTRPRSPPGVPAATGAQVFVKDVPDPENFGVVVYDEAGTRRRPRREGGRRRSPLPGAADERRGRRSLLLPARRLRRDREPRAVEPRRARDHRRQPGATPSAARCRSCRCEGWWEDAGKHWQHLAEIGRTIDETGANK